MRRWPTWAVVVAMVLFALWAIPLQQRQQDIGRTQVCVAHVQLLGMAVLQYVADHDGIMPPVSAFPEGLLGTPPLTRANLVCPADPQRVMPGYAYCPVWAGVKHDSIDAPSCAVMTYEASGGQLAYRHRLGYRGELGPWVSVGYCDGRVEQGAPATFSQRNITAGRDTDYLGTHPAR